MDLRRCPRQQLWRLAIAETIPVGMPHRCRNLRRRADHSGQAIGGYWRETQLVYSRAVLRRGPAMPPWHRARPDSNQWHDIGGQSGSQVTSRKVATGITTDSLLNGLASTATHRYSSPVAYRVRPIHNRPPQ